MSYLKLTIYAMIVIVGIISAVPVFAVDVNSSIFTLEAWVKPTSSITEKAIAAKAEEIRLVTDASGNPVCQIKDTTWQTAATSSSAISVDAWSHIACSYDKVNLKIFVNGVEKDSTALDVAIDDTAAALKLGTDDSDDDIYGEFEGIIDDLRFYNYARSVKQIVSDLNAGHPSTGSPVGSMVGYWKFDEGFGDTANDSSPHNNDGDLAGDCPGDDTCPSWTNAGKFNKALSFDGGDYVDIGDTSFTDVRVLSFWAKPNDTTQEFIELSATDSVKVSSDVVTVTGFGTNTIYVDGIATTSFPDTNWHHIVIVSDTDVTADTVEIGRVDTTYFNGSIDSVKIYNYALTEDEIRVEYNQGKAIILGATGTEIDGKTPSFSASREYCVPGDTTSCAPPVAEWNFNEQTGSSAYDTSENNNTGTITDATWTLSGKHGSALDFDGDGDYVDIGDISEASVKTVELWVKPDAVNVTEEVIDLNGAQYVKITDGTVSGEGFATPTVYVDGSAVSSVTADWHHIAITTDTGFSASDVDIGRLESSSDFDGKIDQVRIYDYARTPAQIAWSYNRGKPVAEWRFDECQGATAHDESGNGNDGTITIAGNGTQTALGTCADGLSTSAWNNGATGKINSAMSFDGTDDYVNIGDTSLTDVRVLSFWAKPNDTTQEFIELSATDSVEVVDGVVTVTGFGTATIYVDGVVSTSFPDTNWHHIVVVSDTDITANTVEIGRVDAAYFKGSIDSVRIYNYALTAEQVKMDYNASSAAHFK